MHAPLPLKYEMSSICRLIGTLSHTNDKRNLKYISNVMAVLLQAQLPCLKLKISRIAEFTLAIKATSSSGIRKKLKECLANVGLYMLFHRAGDVEITE